MKKEVPVKIAVRVPPGDQWVLLNDTTSDGKPFPSIIEVLSEYCRITGFRGNYKLCPMELQSDDENSNRGVLYVLKEEEATQEPKRYNIYGEENYS